MNITIHIERLILDGLPVTRSHGPLVEAAVKAELARLLATDGLNPELQVGGAVPLLKASNIQIGSEGNPNQLGQQIAQAVHGGIGR